MNRSTLVTILLGVMVIAIITPLSQFLTMMTVSADIEVASPVGWAMGLVFTAVLAIGAVRLLAGIRPIHKPQMVVLFTMLSVAAPVMNLGLVRQVYLSMYAVPNEYQWNATNTYRTAYGALDEQWSPLVPTREGLAWAKADRLLRLLDDRAVAGRRDKASRTITTQLTDLSRSLQLKNRTATEATATDTATEPAPDARDGGEPDAGDGNVGSEVGETGEASETSETSEAVAAARNLFRSDAKALAEAAAADPWLRAAMVEFGVHTIITTRAEAQVITGGFAEARSQLEPLLTARARELQALDGPTNPDLLPHLGLIGVDQAASLLRDADQDIWTDAAMRVLGLRGPIEARLKEAQAASAAAVDRLRSVLPLLDEYPLSQTERALAAADYSSRERLDAENARLLVRSQEAYDAMMDRVALLQAPMSDLQQLEPSGEAGALVQAVENAYADAVAADPSLSIEQLLSRDVSRLSYTDSSGVLAAVAKAYLPVYQALEPEALGLARESFVFRVTRDERRQLGLSVTGRPNENLRGFYDSLWADQTQQRQKQGEPFFKNLRQVNRDLPWRLWLRPIAMWCLLFIAMYAFILCGAEWLRRKWVDRENLAFPLVDVVDGLIRHDCALETADDVRDPQPRTGWWFNPMFLIGMALGVLLISIDALAHYGKADWPTSVMTFDFSTNIFTTGDLKQLSTVFFVLSPIVVGIAFLISLELSFSIWMLFVLYTIGVWVLERYIFGGIKPVDSVYTGWAGGRMYPFPAEQMLGATVCFTMILLLKSWRSGRRTSKKAAEAQAAAAMESETSPVTSLDNAQAAPLSQGEASGGGGTSGGVTPMLPGWLTRVGLIGLPCIIVALLWDMGVRSFVLIGVAGFFILAHAIAAARARAETGLPQHHVSYDYTKLPIVFGLTGISGAEAYTRFVSAVFLPMSLLTRLLPQTIENVELARRNRLSYRVVAVASFVAFCVAVVGGMLWFLHFAYFWGEPFWVERSNISGTGSIASFSIARYPLWVSHFLGEPGLDKWNEAHPVRIWAMVAGFSVFGMLSFLRGRFLAFPLNPLGYLLLLISIFYTWVSPYERGVGGGANEASLLWGSVFVAWLVKKLIIKYGGMNTYKAAKPLFIGLIVGSVLCVFGWNMVDLICSMVGYGQDDPANFIKDFIDKAPYSPRFY